MPAWHTRRIPKTKIRPRPGNGVVSCAASASRANGPASASASAAGRPPPGARAERQRSSLEASRFGGRLHRLTQVMACACPAHQGCEAASRPSRRRPPREGDGNDQETRAERGVIGCLPARRPGADGPGPREAGSGSDQPWADDGRPGGSPDGCAEPNSGGLDGIGHACHLFRQALFNSWIYKIYPA